MTHPSEACVRCSATKTPERFWEKVDKNGPLPGEATRAAGLGPCWIYEGTPSKKYGEFRVSKSPSVVAMAHRFAYEQLVGPVPKGLTLDHLCVVPRCVNPAHLEPVTMRENLMRGSSWSARNAAKTHCPQGHPYSGDNLRITSTGGRACRACCRARYRAWSPNRKKKSRAAA